MKERVGAFTYRLALALIAVGAVAGCDLLEKQPLDQLSTNTFWETPRDAKLALTGVYSQAGSNWWSFSGAAMLDSETDNGYSKSQSGFALTSEELTASNGEVAGRWNASYEMIAACNNFLDRIGGVDMEEETLGEMTAEVRFIRAYQYFWLSQFWGGVPLITERLSIQEANRVTRAPRDSVVRFALEELSQAAPNLPTSRPQDEQGRITRAAALAIKGRLQMSEENWEEAASTFRQLMELNVHAIDPDYKSLFEDENEFSTEIILSTQYIEDEQGNRSQQDVLPRQYGGYAGWGVNHDLIEAYVMEDGRPKEDSPLYDPATPLQNRDPRLYQTVFLPGVTEFRGGTFQSHPDSTDNQDVVPNLGSNGYAMLKWADEAYSGSNYSYGGNVPLVRYAEILLSYLEAKMEAGHTLTQSLLDETINRVRGRASTDLPPVTKTSRTELRSTLRTERRVELAFEGLRLWDLMRWGKAKQELTGNFYGMRLTASPQSYNDFRVDEEGYYYNFANTFAEKNWRWPIPQSEIDINPDLEQNPGY